MNRGSLQRSFASQPIASSGPNPPSRDSLLGTEPLNALVSAAPFRHTEIPFHNLASVVVLHLPTDWTFCACSNRCPKLYVSPPRRNGMAQPDCARSPVAHFWHCGLCRTA